MLSRQTVHRQTDRWFHCQPFYRKERNFVSAAGNVFFRRKDNTMNVYDAMWRIFDYAISYLDIVPDTAASNEDVETIAKLLNAYDELEPTVEQ